MYLNILMVSEEGMYIVDQKRKEKKESSQGCCYSILEIIPETFFTFSVLHMSHNNSISHNVFTLGQS